MSVAPTPWLARTFDERPEIGRFPALLERLGGTPARIEEKVRGVAPAALVRRVAGTWSVQENVGHLIDVEPLWDGRLDDLLVGAAVMRKADVTNRATTEAHHERTPIATLLTRLRVLRTAWVARLHALSTADIERSAQHPRLGRPMRTIDLAFFVAEHDDHHLARMTVLLRADTAP
jgi:uncharacterized damage-inducible protein DinB